METTKPGKKSKKGAGNLKGFTSQEKAGSFRYKLVKENNGYKIMEGKSVRGIHRDKSTGKKNNRNKRHMGKDERRQGSCIWKGGRGT